MVLRVERDGGVEALRHHRPTERVVSLLPVLRRARGRQIEPRRILLAVGAPNAEVQLAATASPWPYTGNGSADCCRSHVERMLARPNPSPAPPQEPTHSASGRTVIVKHPGYAWNVDLTLIPTRAGFWVPWLPSALTQRWPFCWWIAVILDHFSRRVFGFAVFKKEPTSEDALRRLVQRMPSSSGAQRADSVRGL